MTLCRTLLPTLAALLLAGAPALGQQDRVTINDEAHMFGRAAIEAAKETLGKADKGDPATRVVIETVESLDGQTIRELAERRHEQNADALYLALAKKEHRISDLQVPRALATRVPKESHDAVRAAFLNEFKKNDFDAGLTRGAAAIAAILARSGGEAEKKESPYASTVTKSPAPATGLVERNRARLTLAGARRALAAAEAKATELGVKENLAVVDDGGHLLAFGRLDGARPASIATAITKATSAATLRQATGPMPATGSVNEQLATGLALQAAASDSGGKITTLLGGVPLLVDGQVVGALGVAGGTGDQDKAVATAGAEAFAAEVTTNPLEPKDPPPALDPLKTPQTR